MDPFLQALHSFRLDAVSGAVDIGILIMIFGAIGIASGGGRAIAGMGGLFVGAFVAVCAQPLVVWLQHLGGI